MRVAIVLAAGSSRRFGRRDKRAALLLGRPLLAHALDRALRAGAPRVLLVMRPDHARTIALARQRRSPRIRVVRADRAREGLAASLAAAIARVKPIEREIALFLADMPFATLPHRAAVPPGFAAARPERHGLPGHPLLVRTAAARTARLSGDKGLAARLGSVAALRAHDGNLLDIDTPAALARARRIAPRLAAFTARLEGGRGCWKR